MADKDPMTVADLIEKLQKYPPNKIVGIWDDEGEQWWPSEVYEHEDYPEDIFIG